MWRSDQRTCSLYKKISGRSKCTVPNRLPLHPCGRWASSLSVSAVRQGDALTHQRSVGVRLPGDRYDFPISHILVTERFVTDTVNGHKNYSVYGLNPWLWSSTYILIKLRSQTRAHYLEFFVLLACHGVNANTIFPLQFEIVLYPLAFLIAS